MGYLRWRGTPCDSTGTPGTGYMGHPAGTLWNREGHPGIEWNSIWTLKNGTSSTWWDRMGDYLDNW